MRKSSQIVEPKLRRRLSVVARPVVPDSADLTNSSLHQRHRVSTFAASIIPCLATVVFVSMVRASKRPDPDKVLLEF